MPLLSKVSNIVYNIFCLYGVTSFTQLWHSIPFATKCKASSVILKSIFCTILLSFLRSYIPFLSQPSVNLDFALRMRIDHTNGNKNKYTWLRQESNAIFK